MWLYKPFPNLRQCIDRRFGERMRALDKIILELTCGLQAD